MTQRLKEGEQGWFERLLGVKSVNVEERSIVHTITDTTIDRAQEIVDPNGVDKRNYEKNPVVLFGHNYRAMGDQIPIIGRAAWVKQEGESLIAKTMFSDATQLSRDAWALAQAGLMPAASIGFLPTGIELAALEDVKDLNPSNRGDFDSKAQVFIYRKWELLEYSLVPIPANPNAVERRALSEALDLTHSEEIRGMLKAALNEKRICELEECRDKMPDINALVAELKSLGETREAELLRQIQELNAKIQTLEPIPAGMAGKTLTRDEARALIESVVAGAISRKRGRV